MQSLLCPVLPGVILVKLWEREGNNKKKIILSRLALYVGTTKELL